MDEAKQFVKNIIFCLEKTRELQTFTTLTEEEQKILRGFYVRKRLKNIIDKSLYIKKRL